MTNEEFKTALANTHNEQEFTEVMQTARREQITRPGEQLELFPTVWNRTDKQAAAAADVLRWVETHGVYVPTGCAALMERARRYAETHRDALCSIMAKAKFTEREQADILADYTAAAQGVTHYTAAPSLMAKAVRELSPRRCYTEDKFLFYVMLFEGYRGRALELARYEDIKSADISRKALYLTPFTPFPSADATAWGLNFGFIDLAEFVDVEAAGIYNADPLIFGGSARVGGDWWRYYRFAWFVTNALQADAAELESITKPPFPVEVEERRKYSGLLEAAFMDFDTENQFANELLTTDGVQGTLSRSLAVLGAGGITGFRLPNSETPGENLLSLLRYKQERGEVSRILYETIERVLNGVNLMFAQGGYKASEGFYSMFTDVTNFARYCGLETTNSDIRKHLLDAMLFLHNIQFIKDGREFLPILFIERERDKRRGLQILLPPDYLKGSNRILATAPQLKALRGAARGAQARFVNLLMTRGHKREDDILKQIYNYDAELNEAERRDRDARGKGKPGEAARKYLNTWKGNKPKRKKQLAKWFKEAQADGVIYSYQYTTWKNGAVYKWTTGDPATRTAETNCETEGKNG